MLKLRISVKPITGLSNQLFCFINGILLAKRAGIKSILYSPFMSCITTLRDMDLGDVIDTVDMSSKTGINILTYDRNTTVEYGIEGNYVNITQLVYDKCMRQPETGLVAVSKCDVMRAALFGDHIPYVEKHIRVNGIKYEDSIILPSNWNTIEYGAEGNYKDVSTIIRDHNLTKIPSTDWVRNTLFGDHVFGQIKNIKVDDMVHKNEHTFNIILPCNWDVEQCPPMWYDIIDHTAFNNLCKQLTFKRVFYNIAESALSDVGLKMTDYFNVVHLRLEEDAIKHWSPKNNMSTGEYKRRLIQRYREHLSHIPNGEILIVLTNDIQDPFIKELEHIFKVHTFDHNARIKGAFGFTGRELSAVVEMIIGSWCKGVFIGCHNHTLRRGSSFSYLLSVMMNNRASFYIDLDKI